jgi:hypothetical protein
MCTNQSQSRFIYPSSNSDVSTSHPQHFTASNPDCSHFLDLGNSSIDRCSVLIFNGPLDVALSGLSSWSTSIGQQSLRLQPVILRSQHGDFQSPVTHNRVFDSSTQYAAHNSSRMFPTDHIKANDLQLPYSASNVSPLSPSAMTSTQLTKILSDDLLSTQCHSCVL